MKQRHNKNLAFEIIKTKTNEIFDLIPIDPNSLMAKYNKGNITGWMQKNSFIKFKPDQITFCEKYLIII